MFAVTHFGKAFAGLPQGSDVRPPATTTSSESFFPMKKGGNGPKTDKENSRASYKLIPVLTEGMWGTKSFQTLLLGI